ncbi:MAG: lambda-exonuclease family protein [Phycisphaerae bacterium]
MSRIVDLIQGSPEWHAYRAKHFNASDAASMLGISLYESRGDLLRRMALGQTPEVSPAQQRVFDRGHEFEAIARPWAEEIVGDELFPVVLEADAEDWDGLPLSASVDGLTMLDDVAFEHKTLNEALATALDAGEIPEAYHPQMEQVLMLTGAERCLFMASAGDRDEARHAWYESRPEMRERLLNGWAQFRADLAEYRHRETRPEPVAEPQAELPTVRVQVSGEIAVSDNLGEFGAALEAYIEELNLSPATDQDFADLDAAVKALKRAEDALTRAENEALSQADSIQTLRSLIDRYRDSARAVRLRAEKAVKAEKEARRAAIRQDAIDAVREHADRAGESLPVTIGVPADLGQQVAAAMKGKKTLRSLEDAADQVVADVKAEITASAERARANIARVEQVGETHRHLFRDLGTLAEMAPDHLESEITARIAEEERRLDAERERIRAEEEARAQQQAEHAARSAHLDTASPDPIESSVETMDGPPGPGEQIQPGSDDLPPVIYISPTLLDDIIGWAQHHGATITAEARNELMEIINHVEEPA